LFETFFKFQAVNFPVDYYGSMVPISQVANISAEDSRTLKVSPWEKEMVAVVEKAIMTSDLGLNPQ
jgi:ribosome recycling factor